jgi:hypothetical protein
VADISVIGAVTGSGMTPAAAIRSVVLSAVLREAKHTLGSHRCARIADAVMAALAPIHRELATYGTSSGFIYAGAPTMKPKDQPPEVT